MAAYHYTIRSKKKAKIQKKDGNTQVLIEQVSDVNENGKDLVSALGEGKPHRFLDIVISVIAFFVAGYMLLLIISTDIIGTIIRDEHFAANMLAVLSLVISIATSPNIRLLLSKFLKFGVLLNKAVLFLLAFAVSYYAAYLVSKTPLNALFSNTLCYLLSLIIFVAFH